jgi:DtxR family Mn-dependent transcriptional regulator
MPASQALGLDGLTGALEDYLETIFELVRDHKLARVKDIAKARGVRSASVTPAMRRLAELGLIRYHQREYIDLTAEGEREARRIYAKHQLLTRLLVEVLGMSPRLAEADACAMEHALSPQGMNHLVRFFEYLRVCPGGRQLLTRFHRCSLVHEDAPPCELDCAAMQAKRDVESTMSLSQLKPGESGRVTQVTGAGAIRQRLLDMGIIPDVELEVERLAPAGDPIWIKLQGFQLSLRKGEAESVLIKKV